MYSWIFPRGFFRTPRMAMIGRGMPVLHALTLTRRTLLQAAALAAGSPIHSVASGPRKDPAVNPKKVLVLGAGLAGLCAGYELVKAGHDVTILEATLRSGGRVLTLRDPFSDGLFAEAGATWVHDNHDIVLRYCSLFDLTLDPVPPPAGAHLYYVRGHRIRYAAGTNIEWPFDLAPGERSLGLPGLFQKYLFLAASKVGSPADPTWPGEEAKQFDSLSLSELLRQQGASDGAASLLTLAAPGDGPDETSALYVLRALAIERSGARRFVIRGGADQLPKAFAVRLAERIRYGAEVLEISQTDGGVSAAFRQAGSRRTLQADRVVCAIPFSVLRHIAFRPPLSTAKHEVIEKMSHVSLARVFVQARSRSWLLDGLSGGATTDGEFQVLHDATTQQPGLRGILEGFTFGPPARRILRKGDAARQSAAILAVTTAFPRVKDEVEGVVIKSWDEDPWARGAGVFFRPGELTKFLPRAAAPEGRIHFAGDHTSAWYGWMQGAFDSAERVVQEIQG